MGFQHGAQFVKEQQKPGSTLLGEANALETPWRRRRKTRRRKTIRKGDAKCSKLAENHCEENASCMLEDGECRAREESAEEKSGDAKLKKLKEGKEPPRDWKRYLRVQQSENPRIQGQSAVSNVCRGLDRNECEAKGCSFEGICKDLSIWECNAQKKIMDCVSYKYLNPFNLKYKAVGVYGILDLTGQLQGQAAKFMGMKTHTFRACEKGYRLGIFCTSHAECPCVTWPESEMKITKEFCTEQPDGRWISRCKEYTETNGFAATTVQHCDRTGYSNFGPMLI